jgi:hypothetical protein
MANKNNEAEKYGEIIFHNVWHRLNFKVGS